MCVLGSTQYINNIKYVFVLTELPAQGFNNKLLKLAIESFNQASKDPDASSNKKTTITMRNKTSLDGLADTLPKPIMRLQHLKATFKS